MGSDGGEGITSPIPMSLDIHLVRECYAISNMLTFRRFGGFLNICRDGLAS